MCPCQNSHNHGWHYRRNLPVCEYARKLREEQRRRNKIGPKLKKRIPASECPCQGMYKRSWHRDRGIPTCEWAQFEEKRERQFRWQKSKIGWEVGESIYVPELEFD